MSIFSSETYCIVLWSAPYLKIVFEAKVMSDDTNRNKIALSMCSLGVRLLAVLLVLLKLKLS